MKQAPSLILPFESASQPFVNRWMYSCVGRTRPFCFGAGAIVLHHPANASESIHFPKRSNVRRSLSKRLSTPAQTGLRLSRSWSREESGQSGMAATIPGAFTTYTPVNFLMWGSRPPFTPQKAGFILPKARGWSPFIRLQMECAMNTLSSLGCSERKHSGVLDMTRMRCSPTPQQIALALPRTIQRKSFVPAKPTACCSRLKVRFKQRNQVCSRMCCSEGDSW